MCNTMTYDNQQVAHYRKDTREMPADDGAKLRDLILYIAERSEGDHSFGKTKLHKILFYADFTSYLETGNSITGQEYRKFPYGPVGEGTEPALQALQREGAAAVGHRNVFGYRQDRPFALREPSLDAFSGKEIAIVDEVI